MFGSHSISLFSPNYVPETLPNHTGIGNSNRLRVRIIVPKSFGVPESAFQFTKRVFLVFPPFKVFTFSCVKRRSCSEIVATSGINRALKFTGPRKHPYLGSRFRSSRSCDCFVVCFGGSDASSGKQVSHEHKFRHPEFSCILIKEQSVFPHSI